MQTRQKGFGAIGILIAIIVLFAVGAAGFVVISHNRGEPSSGNKTAQQATVAREEAKVERTVADQLKPLTVQLEAMGFSNLTDLKTDCRYYTVEPPTPGGLEDTFEEPGEHFTCSSGIDRLIQVPTDKPKFIRQAGDLDKMLLSNGWKLESNTPTTVWAEKISAGKPQADQSYTKKADDLDCSLRFWSAFSNPDPPATSVVVTCGEHYKI